MSTKKKRQTAAEYIRSGGKPRTKWEREVNRRINREAREAITYKQTTHFENQQYRQDVYTYHSQNLVQALDGVRLESAGAYAVFARIKYNDANGQQQTRQVHKTVSLRGQSRQAAVSGVLGGLAGIANEYEIDLSDAEIEVGYLYDESEW